MNLQGKIRREVLVAHFMVCRKIKERPGISREGRGLDIDLELDLDLLVRLSVGKGQLKLPGD